MNMLQALDMAVKIVSNMRRKMEMNVDSGANEHAGLNSSVEMKMLARSIMNFAGVSTNTEISISIDVNITHTRIARIHVCIHIYIE